MNAESWDTVTIVDDHPLARMAIRGVLEKQSLTIVDEFEDGLSAFNSLINKPSDIVIIDVEIPVMNGVELVEKLRSCGFSGLLIVVSAKNERYYSKKCAEAGANAFISKRQEMGSIISAIESAKKGYSFFPFFLKEKNDILTDTERLESLSTQELKVMNLMLSGLDNQHISEAMKISSKTVSTYKTRLMEKLGCNSLIALISFAHKNKLSKQ
ncbi:acid-sensing system DNA-binding response regulator EvgA [Klebsiella sp. BIGb0407]|uniref:acid-sensing system DNA-binding response regulator EvgA n=1 Tax=Klebsiella sp. BIGb0407 TaxID=2940603 RepID=UPI0021675F29|nr:acid-sensing system DNA-binding response regulator EvgA [Klebsiella sp. BIGb0407]MCS3432230.1 two-component system response regulator EvgA [Klebsiella sp. BIGb0407]